MEELLIKSIATQGFPVLLLAGIAWLLYKRQTAMEERNEKRMSEIEGKNEKRIQELEQKLETLHRERKEERAELITFATEMKNVVKENSGFIEKVGEYIEIVTTKKI